RGTGSGVVGHDRHGLMVSRPGCGGKTFPRVRRVSRAVPVVPAHAPPGHRIRTRAADYGMMTG
ncbi:hypothetical protein, partial [Dietzia natronolimnaea]|uniref:hypothetical protein n=1 Tax=Dietzia natronolimnaea TaxID=161920 RepID=UPI0019D6162E